MHKTQCRHALRLPSLALAIVVLLSARAASAGWPHNGLPITVAPDHQFPKAVVTDGAGGVIVTWVDLRNGGEIYAQRVNAAGVPQWNSDGVLILTGVPFHSQPAPEPTVVSDGAGGAIIVWLDARNRIDFDFDVYAQRVSAAGSTLWATNGVPICAGVCEPSVRPKAMADGAGGAIVAWSDERQGPFNTDIYAQRVNAAGVVQWGIDGVAVCTAPRWQADPALATDGANGAIVAWTDQRTVNECDIYAQRVSATGIPVWTTDGVPLCVAPQCQRTAVAISDGAGGAIVAWSDGRGEASSPYTSDDIYAQRVNAAGVVRWSQNGIPICDTVGSQNDAAIASDGAGGAIVAWDDMRRFTATGGNTAVYAQRVDSTGASHWTRNGVALCDDGATQILPVIASDGGGGALVAWFDFRGSYSIYAQKVSGAGTPQWSMSGVPICRPIPVSYGPAITPDGTGGAFVLWGDERNGQQGNPDLDDPVSNVYLQRVTSRGLAGPGSAPAISLSADAEPGRVVLTWHVAGASAIDARVERTGSPEDWRSLGVPTAIDQDRLRYEDTTVQPGERYAYRLRNRDEGVEVFTAETWVDVPEVDQLSLGGFTPNPSDRVPTVAFSLARSERATLEIIDVAGRRVVSREMGSLGAGRHLIRLDDASLEPGIYLIRLRTPERNLIVRGVVTN